jgi:hypothetical protein
MLGFPSLMAVAFPHAPALRSDACGPHLRSRCAREVSELCSGHTSWRG